MFSFNVFGVPTVFEILIISYYNYYYYLRNMLQIFMKGGRLCVYVQRMIFLCTLVVITLVHLRK